MHTRCKTLHFSCKQNYLFYYGKLLLYYIPNHNLVLLVLFTPKHFVLWFLNWEKSSLTRSESEYDLWRIWFFSKSLLNWFAHHWMSFVDWIEWIAAVFQSTNHWFIWSGQSESPVNNRWIHRSDSKWAWVHAQLMVWSILRILEKKNNFSIYYFIWISYLVHCLQTKSAVKGLLSPLYEMLKHRYVHIVYYHLKWWCSMGIANTLFLIFLHILYGIFCYFHLFAHLNYQYSDQCMKDKIVK